VTTRRGMGARAGWVVASQALSSGSNFLLTAIVLAVAPRDEFATFSLCMTTALLLVQVSRSVVSVPVMLSADDGRRRDEDDALGASVLLGSASAVLIVVASSTLGARLAGGTGPFLVLAAGIVPLLVQDGLRHVAFARARPRLAVWSDGAWVLLQVAGLLVAVRAGWTSATLLLGIWAVAGAVAACVLAVLLRCSPSPTAAVPWLRARWPLARRLGSELAATTGGYYLLLYGLAVVAGLGELGRFRAAQTLFGPMSVLLLGGVTFGISETSGVRHDARRLRRLAVAVSTALAAGSLLTGAVVVATLPWFGPALFPEAWAAVLPLVPVLAAYGAGVGASSGATAALRGLDEGSWILRHRATCSAVTVAVGAVTVVLAGAGGAFAALALAEWIFAGGAWSRLSRVKSSAGAPSAGVDAALPESAVLTEVGTGRQGGPEC